MRGSIIRCLLVAFIALGAAETIHFTNSPSHLMGSKNITSYKLLVKNSDPITIIEANKEIHEPSPSSSPQSYGPYSYQNDRMDYDSGGHDANVAVNEGNGIIKQKLVANVAASHQIEPENTHDFRETIGLTVDAGLAEPSSHLAPNELKTTNGDGGGAIKKLVYSPILLKKFVKEYTEKLKNADVGTKNAIQEIHNKIHGSQNSDASENSEHGYVDKDEDSAEQKYNYNSYDSGNRRRPVNSGDRDGWVTLEAVPWSSSSVSKWYANGNDEDRRRPASNNGYSHSERPYSGGSRPNKFQYNNNDNDDDGYYNRPKPSNIDRDGRPTVFSAWTKPQPFGNGVPVGNGRPSRPSQYAYDDSGAFGDAHLYYDRPSLSSSGDSSRPWTGDIITDNRPSNFPSELSSNYYNNNNKNDGDRYSSASGGHTHYSSHQTRPSEGSGEWVLISTTKGYQIPGGNRRQHGKRAMSLSSSAVTINVPQSVQAHKGIKLTVLPAIGHDHNNSTFSTDANDDKTHMITSHGGLLEIDSTHESVDDDVRATAQAAINQLTQSADKPVNDANLPTKRRRVMKVMATNNDQDQSTEILAAVGAGMVPATMAILMPMVLGRKKRNVHIPKLELRPPQMEQST